MRKKIISVFIGLTIFISSFGLVYAISAGSELVRDGSRNDRELQFQPINLLSDGQTAAEFMLAPEAVWKIGAFLPLTGAYAGIGLRFRHGLELALAAEKIAVYSWQIDYIDSAEISTAVALADFKGRGVDIVLGPIQSSLARPVAQAATSLHLPLILLAPQPELANTGSGVFQHFFNAADEAREIVRLLYQHQQLRVALLSPENSFGRLFSQVFTEACLIQKIAVWKKLSYNPATVDFSSVIKGLRQPQPGSDYGLGKEEDVVPRYPFSALVIADFWPRLRLIVPQLAFFGVEQPQLYATSRGGELNFKKVVGDKLEGIIFIDSSFHSPQPSHLVENYKKSYFNAYSEPASIYDAYAYDTVQILTAARELMDRGERVDLAGSLLELPTLELVTGTTTVTDAGVFVKQLCPVTYESGKLTNVH